MKKNIYDTSTDILKNRIEDAYKLMAQNYKGTNPYRQKPVDPKEAIYAFSQFTPQQIEMARQSMGNDVVDNYLTNIQDMIRRQKNV